MFKEGSIRKITMKDFVTYSYAEMLPGSNLNMLIGPNGTGKSTIVAAIILGLGGSPKTVGRGTKIQIGTMTTDHNSYNSYQLSNTPGSYKNKLLKFLPEWSSVSGIIALFLLALVLWAIGYSLFKETVGLESQLFSLAILFITAKITGCLVGLIKIPPMVGMLLMGVLLRNVGFLHITGRYTRFADVLRQIALVNILLPAGLGLDAKALKKMKWMIINLAIVPVAVEVIGVAVLSHFLIDLPWLWGILLGFVGSTSGSSWLQCRLL